MLLIVAVAQAQVSPSVEVLESENTSENADVTEDETGFVPGSVIINEVMWMGSSSSTTADEWIELRNLTDQKIDLDGWQITGAGSSGALSLSGILMPNDYFLISHYDSDDPKSLLSDTIEVDLVKSAVSLKDDGEELKLQACEDDECIDIDTVEINDDGWPAGIKKEVRQSMERNSDPVTGWHTCVTESCKSNEFWEEEGAYGTPRAENSELEVNNAPVAEVAGPEEGLVGDELEFSGENSEDSDGDELSYEWDCGNDQTGTDVIMKCKYADVGEYTINLRVSDGTEEDEASKQVIIQEREYSDAMILNEVFPNPEGKDSGEEFVEVYNQDGDEVDLTDWQLVYGSTTHVISDIQINGHGYVVWTYTVKNGGSTIYLKSPDGEEKDKIEYGVIPEGQSYARNSDGDWEITTTVTRGEKNKITEQEDEEESEGDVDEEDEEESVVGDVDGEQTVTVAIAEVRQQEKGSNVTIEGVVSVAPGMLSERTIYLSGSGIQIYSYDGFPELTLGDTVRLTGELTELSGEARVKLAAKTSVAKVSSNSELIPHEIKTGEVGEETEGWLVRIAGTVTSTSGNVFYVDDGSGEVKIYINANTGIQKPKMSKGMDVTIVGVVSETGSGYRILPRIQDDVLIGGVGGGASSLPKTGWDWDGMKFGISITVGLIVSLLLMGWGYWSGEPVWKI